MLSTTSERTASSRTKFAELTSGIGALVLGIGIGGGDLLTCWMVLAALILAIARGEQHRLPIVVRSAAGRLMPAAAFAHDSFSCWRFSRGIQRLTLTYCPPLHVGTSRPAINVMAWRGSFRSTRASLRNRKRLTRIAIV
jgi:hypothetical protein